MSKRKRLLGYGELAKGILEYFIEVDKDIYYKNLGRRGVGLLYLIDHLGYLLKSVKTLQEKKLKINRVLQNLEKNDILDLQEENGKVTVYLKDKNHPKIIEYSIKSLLDFKIKEKKWDGKWFLVFFDVPEAQRNKRDYLRKFLIKLGFYQYQKSVYLFPYECEKEVSLIKKIVEGAKYMKYIIAEKIEDELSAKEYFKLLS
ncbi:CRISPR-associated endonuclease Cas2 [Candidatus Roizmanbacteria bacterium CG_4_9_14_3_um_filter_33_18]|uniref:CRISPR-associated endonuclease Cas2 n=1 Tax=Candidatus Roizmanbacteria bacterium CG_4_9_14_3_um_filter_33_18 TaxID=1974841 RepID=A0A2M7XZ32_9BACT|nr:MAG: CRISPR-associated endonuclease Cas2 [Candidatus Roizmanbacteria bacterium CG_4_9_14_3_um_filter_33_18]